MFESKLYYKIMNTENEIIKKKFLQRRFFECIDLCNNAIQENSNNAFAYLVRSASNFILKNQYKDKNHIVKDIPEIIADYNKALELEENIHQMNSDIEFYIYSPYRKISFWELPTAERVNTIERIVNYDSTINGCLYEMGIDIIAAITISALICAGLYQGGISIYLCSIPFLLTFIYILFFRKKYAPPKRKTWDEYSKDFGCKISLAYPQNAEPVWWKEDEYSIEAKELYKYIENQWSDFKPVIELCTKAIEKDANDALAYYVRAMAKFSGQIAIDDYNKAVELDKDIVKKNPEIERRIASIPDGCAYIFNRPITNKDYGYLVEKNGYNEKRYKENFKYRKEFPQKYGCKTDSLTWSEVK